MNDLQVRRRRKPLSDAQFLKDAEAHIAELAALAMFADTKESSSEERRARAQYDFDYFCATYLPLFFTDDKAEWHDEFDRDVETTDTMLALTAMRGGGKSTRMFAHELHWILYRRRHFIVHVLDTFDKATDYTHAILIELQYNERIRHDFGVMVSNNAAASDFTTFDPHTHAKGTRVLAFGIEMGFRGLREGAFRPDAIIFEDVQDRESAESTSRTAKIIRIILRDAKSALVPEGWSFIVLGNIICRGSVMDEFLHEKKYGQFVKRRYPAIVTEGGVRRSTFGARFPLELLDKLKTDMTDREGNAAFLVEYMCQAVEIGRIFQERRDLHHWKELPAEIDLSDPVIQLDQGESGFSDFTAIGVCTVYAHHPDRSDWLRWRDPDGKPYGEGVYVIFVEILCRQLEIDEVIDTAADIIDKYAALDSHWDGSVNKELIWSKFISQWEVRNHRMLPVTFDRFLINKELRVKAMQPIMGRGRLLLPPAEGEDMLNVRTQILRFGTGDYHDDAPDMIAAAVENCDPYQDSAAEVTRL